MVLLIVVVIAYRSPHYEASRITIIRSIYPKVRANDTRSGRVL